MRRRIPVLAVTAAMAAAALGADPPAEAVAFRPASASTIPSGYLALYRASAGACRGLRWEALAAVGRLESDHGRSSAAGVHSGQNAWGAAGPMQFLAATWMQWGTSNPADRYDPAKAVPAAARYLCAIGVGSDEFHAFSSYFSGPAATGASRAAGDAYATKAKRQADNYAATAGSAGTSGNGSGAGGSSGGASAGNSGSGTSGSGVSKARSGATNTVTTRPARPWRPSRAGSRGSSPIG